MPKVLERGWRRASLPIRRSLRKIDSSKRAWPVFIVIGAQKSGTTALFDMITSHPRCQGSMTKEVHYFDFRYHLGEAWYRSHFPYADKNLVAGEASPYYLVHPHAPERIANDIPHVRMVAILRDPVERAISHYFHERRAGREHKELADALHLEGSRISADWRRMCNDSSFYSRAHQSFSYVQRGRYVEQLDRYWRLFDQTQLLVISSEALRSNTRETLSRVFKHIGVQSPNVGSVIKNSNVGANKAAVPAVVRSSLSKYFKKPNEELFEALGERFDWQ